MKRDGPDTLASIQAAVLHPNREHLLSVAQLVAQLAEGLAL